jgi:hypothetical protein
MKFFFSNFISFLIIACTAIILGRKSRRRIKRRWHYHRCSNTTIFLELKFYFNR